MFQLKGSGEDDSMYTSYPTTWIALFHMTLGEYEVGFLNIQSRLCHKIMFQYEEFKESNYSSMAKTVFVLFQILIPILLLNMLIAMMGNTYAIIIETADKQFLKQVKQLYL